MHQLIKKVVLTSALPLVLTNCGVEQTKQKALEVKKTSIVGGTYNSKSPVELLKAVVGIARSDNRTCTGTLIDQNTVFTAAHCILPTLSDRERQTLLNRMKKLYADRNLELTQGRLYRTAKLTMNAHAETVKRSLTVYTGNGDKGSTLSKMESINAIKVATIQLSRSYVDNSINFLAFGIRPALNPHIDWAILKLETPLVGIKPIPMLSNFEVLDAVNKKSKIVIAGFGLEMDRRYLNAIRKNRRQAWNLYQETGKKDDEVKYEYYQQQYQAAQAKVNNSGRKKYLQLNKLNDNPIDDITEILVVGKTVNHYNSGGCNGDSGGPTFIHTSGGLKLIGNMIAVNVCGNLTYIGLHGIESVSPENAYKY